MITRALAVFALLLSTLDLHAQCPNIPTQSDRQTTVWARNLGSVYVYIDARFTDPVMRNYLYTAVNTWSNSSTAMMMGLELIPTTDHTRSTVHVWYVDPYNPQHQEQWIPRSTTFGVHGGEMRINTRVTDPVAAAQTLSHGLGHPFGLADCGLCGPGTSTMTMPPPGGFNDRTAGHIGPTPCDEQKIKTKWEPWFKEPEDDCSFICMQAYATDDTGCYCPSGPDKDEDCEWCSPIILDLKGDGIALTGAADGVDFDLDANGRTQRLGWTRAGSDDGWLVLDRNCNGAVDDGSEMFGNYTDQPPADEPHGYAALALFDARAHGGNANGSIDAGDAIFARLRIWRDRNHDGRSDATELDALPVVNVVSIDLDFRTSNRRDTNGNLFRYRSKVTSDGTVHHWSYDVFLDTEP